MDVKIIDRYCRLVGKYLICYDNIKYQLLSGLKSELMDNNYPDDMSLEQLKEAYGSPKSIADQFRDAISEEEYIDSKKIIDQKRRKRSTILVAIMVAVIVLLVTFLALTAHSYDSYAIETIIPGESFLP